MTRRLLFVLSRDFGELFNAAYFVEGQLFDSTFLLPSPLYEINRTSIGHRCERFDSSADVVKILNRDQPDLIFLFSGYLYAINGIVGADQIPGFLAELRAYSGSVCTSDPSNGLLTSVSQETIDVRRTGRRSLIRHLRWLSAALSPFPHLYTAPPLYDDPQSFAFFNECLLWPRPPGSNGHVVPTEQQWLFVLSSEDHEIQRRERGRMGFAKTLALKLSEATAAGKRPMLVAPAGCRKDLRAVGLRLGTDQILDACSIVRFLELLRDAEHVFYWNMFSASLLARGLNARSFFSFAPGHLSQIMPGFLERATEQFYGGSRQPLLRMDRPLDEEELRGLATRQHAALAAARERLRLSMTPTEVVERLIQQGGPRPHTGLPDNRS